MLILVSSSTKMRKSVNYLTSSYKIDDLCKFKYLQNTMLCSSMEANPDNYPAVNSVLVPS